MKSLKIFVYWAGMASMTLVQAQSGLDAYRLGQYDQAATELTIQSGKDPMADYYIGRMQLYGYGLLKNTDNALARIQEAAKRGYTPAQQFMARYALSIEKNPENAFQWFSKLAAKDIVSAQLYVIGAYKYGYGVNKNPQMASRLYIRAAKEGNAIAQYMLAREFLASRNRRNHNLGLSWLKKSVAQNYPRAQTYLAQMYLAGVQVRSNTVEAVDLLEAAADRHYVPAMLSLAELAQKNGQSRVAKMWWQKAADAGNPEAMLALAAMYLDGNSDHYEPATGFMWTTRAAQLPSPAAKKALAALYKEGHGVSTDKALAEEWQRKAAAAEKNSAAEALEREMVTFVSGDQAEHFAQTDYYLHGILTTWQNPDAKTQAQYHPYPRMQGVTSEEIFKPQFSLVKPDSIDFKEYFDLLAPMLSANGSKEWRYPRYPIDIHIQKLMDNEMLIYPHGAWHSMVNEGRPYPQATANDQEWHYLDALVSGWQQRANLYVVVMRLYNQAILGNSDAQFEIGQLYHYGIGVAKDPEQARLYYQLAAEQNDVRAEYNLGILYMEGQIQPTDYEKGMAWLTDAAFRGNAYAQYALANIYQYGYPDASGRLVVAPDEQQAMSMYYLSSANHFGLAQYKLANALVAKQNRGLTVAARQNRAEIIKKLYSSAAEQSVADAFLPLAFYLAMDSDAEKQRQALQIAEEEAKVGNPQAPLLLGLLYDRGIGVAADPVKALYWYQQADNTPVKSFILGTYYSLGEGLNKDIDRARKQLTQAADAGFSYADLNLAILNQQAGQPFLFDLMRARDEGNVRASLLLADYYLAQNDADNFAQAREIYTALADKGERDAQLKLGYLYSQGIGGAKDNAKAAQWLRKAAQQGQPMAQFLLADLYQLGRIGKEPDVQEAITWYTAASERMPRAAVALGFLYDTAQDQYAKAMSSYQLAAKRNHPLGQYNLGLLYEEGKGMPVDMSKAREWYSLAASQQQAQAMTRLGMMDFYGRGGEQNEAAALDWFNKAAAAGDRTAAYQLGLLAETGIARKLDMGDAVQYYEQAAKLGDVKASLALARIYQYGLGGFAEPAKAQAIYRALADHGNAFAQYQLAVMRMDSALDDKGWADVKALLKAAQTNGNPQAERLLQKVNALRNDGSSFIEPLWLNQAPLVQGVPAERFYREALNEWNQGDSRRSKMMLERLLEAYPKYMPASKAYEQMSQPLDKPAVG
ncbi:MAG: sel1 repeat family protein [Legionellaceae bacterium]|nr:sel1 repeat family protein [Legionellaceae bacterium]